MEELYGSALMLLRRLKLIAFCSHPLGGNYRRNGKIPECWVYEISLLWLTESTEWRPTVLVVVAGIDQRANHWRGQGACRDVSHEIQKAANRCPNNNPMKTRPTTRNQMF